jgi:hypothetical protein
MVNQNIQSRFSHLHPGQQCALVAVVLIAALALAVPIGMAVNGALGAWAAIAAGTTVLIASALSIYAANAFASREAALWRLLFSMGLRMAIPLAACLVVLLVGGPLVSGGFVYFVLALYLVALPIDTFLAMPQTNRKPDASF